MTVSQEQYDALLAQYNQLASATPTKGFAKFTGGEQIPVGQSGSANNSQITAAQGFRKNGALNLNYTTDEGLQRLNSRRAEAYANSATKHNKPFRPWMAAQIPEGAKGPLSPYQNRTLTWAESNGEAGWQPGEKIVAIDGYRMKRLPDKRILAKYIETEGPKAPADRTPFKQFVKEGRIALYKAKHDGRAPEPSAMAMTGKAVGAIFRTWADQNAPYQSVSLPNGKHKEVRMRNGQPLPRNLFAQLNKAVYNDLAQYVWTNAYNGQTLPATKEAKKEFSDTMKETIPQYVSEELVLQKLSELLK
jgi:hypothetical protein